VLADSPSDFHDGARILPIEQNEHFEMTSRGLRIARQLDDAAIVQPDCLDAHHGQKVILISCVYVDRPHGQLGLNVVHAKDDVSGSLYTRVMHGPIMVHVHHLREGQFISARDQLLSEIGQVFPIRSSHVSNQGEQVIAERFAKVQSYLEERASDSIYISRSTLQGQRKDRDGAYCLFPRIAIVDKRFDKSHPRNFVILCSAVRPDNVELHSAAIESERIVAYVKETKTATRPSVLLCQVVISRSRNASLLDIVKVVCLCGGDCLSEVEASLKTGKVECLVNDVRVLVSIGNETLSGRLYNVIQFAVFLFEESNQTRKVPKSKGSMLESDQTSRDRKSEGAMLKRLCKLGQGRPVIII
jgi:hypothetical protein